MPISLAERFRGFLPVVVDVETAGFCAQTDALLELAAIPILMNDDGVLYPSDAIDIHFNPFAGANLEAAALKFTGICIDDPKRRAIAQDERTGFNHIFKTLNAIRKQNHCRKCILVGHNAHFDLSFINAAVLRTKTHNKNPFHPFSVMDTASLSLVTLGHSVLAQALSRINSPIDNTKAHSALYDATQTAKLFCHIVNHIPLLHTKTQASAPQSNTK